MSDISLPWINKRRKILLEICLEFIFFSILIYLNKSLTNFSISNYIILFCLIFLWVIINYVSGRYHSLNVFQKKSYLKDILTLSLSSILIIIIYKLFIYDFDKILNSSEIVNLFIYLSLLSYITQTIFIKLKIKDFDKKTKAYLCLNKNIQNKILYEFNQELEEQNIILECNSLSDNYSSDNFDLIIYEEGTNNNLINNKEKNNLNYINWIGKTFQRYPSTLIDKKYILNSYKKSFYNKIQHLIKRIFEFFFSIFLIFFSLPIIFISAIFIYLEDKGPIFYSQIRTGKFEKAIKIYKLRTMKINAEESGAQWAMKADSRITFVGRILRKFRIDELPQLFNVLIGDMSLIGPRPERPEFDKKLKKEIKNYDLRFKFKPGLSGWAQVNYPYGSSLKDSDVKLSYDLFYMKHFSLFFDLLIFFKTINLICNARGATPND